MITRDEAAKTCVYTCFTASRPKGPVNVAKSKPVKNPKKRAAIMVRRSKKNRERMESVPNQIAANMAYAEQNDYEVVTIYQDDGKTGKNTKRPGLQKLLEDAKTGAFQYVIVWKLDRTTRRVRDLYEIEDQLAPYGVKIVSATEYVNDGSISAKMNKLFAMAKAEIDLDILTENTMRGLMGNARANMTCGGRAALGYVWDKKKLKIDPFRAEGVQMAFDMYSKGYSKTEIIKKLAEEGHKNSTGGDFKITSLSSMFQNQKYIGTYTYNNDIENIKHENAVPAIVDKETFYKVQNRINEGRKDKKVSVPRATYALSGMVTCAECKRKMQVDKSRNGRAKTVYYNFFCPGKRKYKDCDTKQVNMLYVEELVIDLINRNIAESFGTVKAGIEGAHGKLNAAEKKERLRLQQEIGKISESVRKLTYRIGEDENDDVAEEIKAEIRERKAQKTVLEARLESLADKEKPNITDKRLNKLLSVLGKTLIANGTNLNEKRVLHALIQGITVDNTKIVVDLNLP